eukprot:5316507-Pleurochrysis_carterae.AAC.1
MHARRALSESRGRCVSHEGLDSRSRSLRASYLLVSCVVLGPWKRELPCLQAARRDREAGAGVALRTHWAGTRQGLESTAAQSL